MPTQILYAKPVIEKNCESLKQRVDKLKEKGLTPSLKVVLVGEHGPSVIYTRNKKNFCEKIGADCEIVRLQQDISESDFLSKVDSIVSDDKVNGCLIQLPLPEQLKHIDVTKLVPSNKDVDGFHVENVGELYKGASEQNVLAPCTPKGIMELLRFYNISTEGKKVAIIGRSLIVGKPMALMMTNNNATVLHCHSKTSNLKEITKSADIIVSAVGKPKFLGPDYIGTNSPVVIDVGINYDNNKLCGDVDFEAVKDLCSSITPVPGGVGPLTILMLAENLLLASEKEK